MIKLEDLEVIEDMDTWFYEGKANHYFIRKSGDYYKLSFLELIDGGENVKTTLYACSSMDTALQTIEEEEAEK